MANEDIRAMARENGVYLWQIAERLQCSDGNFSRKLRREFSEKDKNRVQEIVKQLKERK